MWLIFEFLEVMRATNTVSFGAHEVHSFGLMITIVVIKRHILIARTCGCNLKPTAVHFTGLKVAFCAIAD